MEADRGIDGRERKERTLAVSGVFLLAGVWVVMVWPKSANFDFNWFPGASLILLVVATLCVFAPWYSKLGRMPVLALVGLVFTGLWSAASMLWSPTPDMAYYAAQLALLYAAAYVAGIWLTQLSGRRVDLMILAVVFALAVLCALTSVVLAGGADIATYLEENTLRFPVGLRNANAALFALAVWPATAVAARTGAPAWRRAVGLGTLSMALSLIFLCQSRASVPAGILGLAAYAALARPLLRSLVMLGLGALPVAVALPTLTSIYHIDLGTGVQAVNRAGVAVLVAGAAGAAFGALSHVVERRLRRRKAVAAWSARIGWLAVACVITASVTGFVVKTGSPWSWFESNWSEFVGSVGPDDRAAPTRFSAGAGTERDDYWRVALDDFAAAPLWGVGAGGFSITYLEDRNTTQEPTSTHNLVLGTMSELGAVGLLALLAFLFGAAGSALGCWRRDGRTSGESRAPPPLTDNRSVSESPAGCRPAVAAILATACGWLVAAMLDPIWERPEITAPVIVLLGAASVCASSRSARTLRRARRLPAVAGIVLLLATGIPAYAAALLVKSAASNRSTDPAARVRDLDAASKLNPLAASALVAKAALLAERGDRESAVADLDVAVRRQPDLWRPRFLLGKMLEPTNSDLAASQFEEAHRLNPGNPDIVDALKRSGR